MKQIERADSTESIDESSWPSRVCVCIYRRRLAIFHQTLKHAIDIEASSYAKRFEVTRNWLVVLGFLLRSIEGSRYFSQRQVNGSFDSSKLRYLRLRLSPTVRPPRIRSWYAIRSPYEVISAALKNIGTEFDNRLSKAIGGRPVFSPISITYEGISILVGNWRWNPH